LAASPEKLERQIEQLELQLEELESAKAAPASECSDRFAAQACRPATKPVRQALPEHLPREAKTVLNRQHWVISLRAANGLLEPSLYFFSQFSRELHL
jgi:hypothetical protein